MKQAATIHVYQTLEDIEIELKELMQGEQKSWQRTAKLLIEVRDKDLYKQKCSSYTKWVKSLAIEFKIFESNFWRILNAGKYFLDITGSSNVEDIEEAKATPEQLELVEKISRYAPKEVKEELYTKALEGDLVREELRKTWQEYRKVGEGETCRGRKKEMTMSISPVMGSVYKQEENSFKREVALYEDKGLRAVNRIEEFFISRPQAHLSEKQKELLTSANIIEALRKEENHKFLCENSQISEEKENFSYSDLFKEVSISSGITRAKTSMDILILKKAEKEPFPFIYGIEIKENAYDLENDHKMSEYTPFCHYMYLAIPESKQMREKALEVTPENIGLLLIDERLHLTVFRKAERLAAENAGDTYGALLSQAVRWQNI